MAAKWGSLSHALAGHLDEAQKLMAHMRGLDPALRISKLVDKMGRCPAKSRIAGVIGSGELLGKKVQR